MDVFNDLDDETTALIIQFQLEDSAALIAAVEGKGKGRDCDLSDAQVALELYGQDLQRSETYFKDHQLSRSISLACMRDGDRILATRLEEQTCVRDHEMACELSGLPVPRAVEPLIPIRTGLNVPPPLTVRAIEVPRPAAPLIPTVLKRKTTG